MNYLDDLLDTFTLPSDLISARDADIDVDQYDALLVDLYN